MIDLTYSGKNKKKNLSSSSYSAINSARKSRARSCFLTTTIAHKHSRSSNALDLVFLWPVYEQLPFFRRFAAQHYRQEKRGIYYFSTKISCLSTVQKTKAKHKRQLHCQSNAFIKQAIIIIHWPNWRFGTLQNEGESSGVIVTHSFISERDWLDF